MTSFKFTAYQLPLAIVLFCTIVTHADDPDHSTRQLGIVRDPEILEASGLAISRNVENAIWMHNDSGDQPRLFLVAADGNTIAIVSLKGAEANDWEDMCSFELDGESWLLIGDIGDNARQRGLKSPTCRLYLIREPKLDSGRTMPVEITVDVVRTIEFQFPDGPHDCESLAVDTTSRTILLVTKSDPTDCAMYSLPLTLTKGSESVKAKSATAIGATFATAMDISPDGRRLVIVSMFAGVMVTRDDPKLESWSSAVAKSVTVLTLPRRKQGESVCFTADGAALILNSEGASQPLWHVALGPIGATSLPGKP